MFDAVCRKLIYRSEFWKTKCFLLDELTFIDVALELRHFELANANPFRTPDFVVLLFKLNEINPSLDTLREFLRLTLNFHFIALVLLYCRLKFRDREMSNLLLPFRFYTAPLSCGSAIAEQTLPFDEFVFQLFTAPEVFDLLLPQLPPSVKLWVASRYLAGVN